MKKSLYEQDGGKKKIEKETALPYTGRPQVHGLGAPYQEQALKF